MPAHHSVPARLDRAALAWARCRRLMARTSLAAAAATLLSLLYLRATGAPVPVRAMIAAAASLGLAALLVMAMMAAILWRGQRGDSHE